MFSGSQGLGGHWANELSIASTLTEKGSSCNKSIAHMLPPPLNFQEKVMKPRPTHQVPAPISATLAFTFKWTSGCTRKPCASLNRWCLWFNLCNRVNYCMPRYAIKPSLDRQRLTSPFHASLCSECSHPPWLRLRVPLCSHSRISQSQFCGEKPDVWTRVVLLKKKYARRLRPRFMD